MSDENRISELRSELSAARQRKIQETALHQQRESLEKELDHLTSHTPFPSGENHEEERAQRQESIRAIRQKLVEIDHQLDHIGEEQESEEEAIKFELTQALLASYPAHESRHTEWVAGQQKMRELIASCQALQTECWQVESELNQADRLWEKAKGRSWFHKIFGANPTVVVASHMEKAGHAAMRVLPQLSGYERLGPLQPLIEQLRELFRAMGEVADSRWGFKSMEKTVHPFYHRFHEIIDAIKQIEARGEKELEALNKEVEHWLAD